MPPFHREYETRQEGWHPRGVKWIEAQSLEQHLHRTGLLGRLWACLCTIYTCLLYFILYDLTFHFNSSQFKKISINVLNGKHLPLVLMDENKHHC